MKKKFFYCLLCIIVISILQRNQGREAEAQNQGVAESKCEPRQSDLRAHTFNQHALLGKQT